MTEFGNNMIILGEAKKKGDGVNAVLTLMKDLRDFQEKVDDAADAQINPANKTTIQGFSTDIEKMYGSLLDMAKGGIRTIREQEPEVQKDNEIGGEATVEKGKTVVTPPVAPSI
jgi:hypothetical protein